MVCDSRVCYSRVRPAPNRWFVTQRQERIDKFRPQDFWQIELQHTAADDSGESVTAKFGWARHRLYDRLSTLLLYDLCVERDTATVHTRT